MLTSIISSHIQGLYGDISFSPTLSAPPKPEHGEYCFGVFSLAKPLGKSPNIIAEEIATVLQSDIDNFTQVNTIGGYVNLSCTGRVWLDILNTILCPVIATEEAIHASETTGSLRSSRGQKQKTIVVDYIGANIGKPLHIGHLCTPSIGQVFCNVYKYLGYKVIGDVHTGDWGGIFGKLIVGHKLGEIIKINDILSFSESPNKNIQNNLFKNYQHLAQIFIEKRKYPDPVETGIQSAIDRFSGDTYIGLSNRVNEPGFPQEYLQYVNDQYIVLMYICENDKITDDLCREEFKRLSHGDLDNQLIWAAQTKISLELMQKILDLFNVHYDVAIGESFYEGLNLPKIGEYPNLQFTMKDIVVDLLKNGIATKNNEDGSVGVIFESWENNKNIFDEKTWEKIKKLPSNMLQKRDGTHGYFASDLACIKYRVTNGWNPSKIIYCTDIRQELHFKQVFTVAKMAGWIKSDVELIHAPNGFITLPDGAMSTRKGKVISLSSLIDEGFVRTKSILEEKGRTEDNSLSEIDIQEIAVGAIKYSYLMQDRERNVTFDWDKALSFEGNSGPYIQYACVRAAKVTKNQTIKSATNDVGAINLSQYDTALIRTLAEMEAKIQTTADTYKPHTLALYCYDLAVCFNSFYVHTPKILEESDENLKYLRLELCRLVSEKLTLGFNLLGIKMPSEM